MSYDNALKFCLRFHTVEEAAAWRAEAKLTFGGRTDHDEILRCFQRVGRKSKAKEFRAEWDVAYWDAAAQGAMNDLMELALKHRGQAAGIRIGEDDTDVEHYEWSDCEFVDGKYEPENLYPAHAFYYSRSIQWSK